MGLINLKKTMDRTVKNPGDGHSVTSGVKRSYAFIVLFVWGAYVGLNGFLSGKCGIEYFLFAVSLALLEWFSSPIYEAIGNCLSKIIKLHQIKGKSNE